MNTENQNKSANKIEVPTATKFDPFLDSLYYMVTRDINPELLKEIENSVEDWKKELHADFGLKPWSKLLVKMDSIKLSDSETMLMKEQTCFVFHAANLLSRDLREYQHAYIFNTKWSARRRRILKRFLKKLEDIREMYLFMDTYALGDIGPPPFVSSSYFVLRIIVDRWPEVRKRIRSKSQMNNEG